MLCRAAQLSGQLGRMPLGISGATRRSAVASGSSHHVKPLNLLCHTAQVQYGRGSGQLGRTALGSSGRYSQVYSNASYTSGFSHHVKLPHLLPNTTYWYRWAHPS